MKPEDYEMRILPTENFSAKKMGLVPNDCETEIIATVGDTYGHRVQIVKVTTETFQSIQMFSKLFHGGYEKISYIEPIVLEVLKTIEIKHP